MDRDVVGGSAAAYMRGWEDAVAGKDDEYDRLATIRRNHRFEREMAAWLLEKGMTWDEWRDEQYTRIAELRGHNDLLQRTPDQCVGGGHSQEVIEGFLQRA